MTDGTAQDLESGVQIVFAIPGRVRLRARGSDAQTTLNALEQALGYQNGIREIYTNLATGSAIVLFDPIALPLPHLLELLRQCGVTETSVLSGIANQTDALAPWKSTAFWKKQGRSFLPLIVGLVVTRGLGLFGWRSLLAYMVTASATRQLIELVDSDSSLEKIGVPTPIPQSTQGQMKDRGESRKNKEESPKLLPFSKEMLTVESSLAIAYTIVHAIPGRLRFQVPRIAEDSQYEKRLQKLAESTFGVTSVRINSTAASIVVNYDLNAVSPGQMRSRLSELIQEADSDKTATIAKAPPPPPPPPAPPANIDADISAESDAEAVNSEREEAIAPASIPAATAEETDIATEEAIASSQIPQSVEIKSDIETEEATQSQPVLQSVVLDADSETEEATQSQPVLQSVVLEADSKTEEVTQSQPVLQSVVLDADSETEEVTQSQPVLQSIVLDADSETEEATQSQPALQSTNLEVNADTSKQVVDAQSETQSIQEDPVNFWYCLWQTVRSTVQGLRSGQPPMNALISGLRDAGAIS